MGREYRPDFRENDSLYLIRQAQELCAIAKEHKNSSPLIYACLECRIALEVLDLQLIYATVNPEERLKIQEESKPKNGIDRINKKKGSLKHKYQEFFQSVNEILELPGKYYDFKQSKDLQHRLSFYIHSYWFTEKEVNYNSKEMKKVFDLVKETNDFVYKSLPKEGDSLIISGIDLLTMPEEDKALLDQWKLSEVNDYEELKEKLKTNLKKRDK